MAGFTALGVLANLGAEVERGTWPNPSVEHIEEAYEKSVRLANRYVERTLYVQ